MANCVFGYPNYSDVGVLQTPSLSGGSWLNTTDIKLSNLQNRDLAKVARSTNALAASTTFDCDLGATRSLRVFCLVGLNITSAGTVRVRTSTVSNFATTVYDSTALTPYPSGHTAETLEGMTVDFIHVAASAGSARYVRFDISDTSNPDGYIQIKRLVVAAAWQPTINLSVGAKLGLETETTFQVTDGGSKYYNRKPVRRTQDFTIELLENTETFGSAYDMQRIAGTDRQLYFVTDPSDTTQLHRRSFLCTMRELSGIEYAHSLYNRVAFRLSEEL